MKYIKSIIISISLFFIMIPFVLPVQAQTSEALDKLGKNIGFTDTSLAEGVGGIIQAGLSLIGILMMVLLVYAGILWMTARGDSAQVDKAKDIIRAVVIGAIIVFGAYGITTAVIGTLF